MIHRVVIAGAGVAGLEAMLALRHLAGDRLALTVLAPEDRFVVRALSVAAPFAAAPAESFDTGAICAEHGAELVSGALTGVDANRGVAHAGEQELPFDSLLVAVGARAAAVYREALTFRGPRDVEPLRALVEDLERGEFTRVAFVVPPGVTWALPLYELALLTAEHAEQHGLELSLSLVTAEPSPLALLGSAAGDAVEPLLADRGIALRTGTRVREVRDGELVSEGGRRELRAERVVALPRLSGPGLPGLPADEHGFVPVDGQARVRGLAAVFAAGDGTTMPIKQGGIAAQQAGAAAAAIAERGGARVAARELRPVLRAQLLAGSGVLSLRRTVAGRDAGDDSQAEAALAWPPTKVAAPHLSPYLQGLAARA